MMIDNPRSTTTTQTHTPFHSIPPFCHSFELILSHTTFAHSCCLSRLLYNKHHHHGAFAVFIPPNSCLPAFSALPHTRYDGLHLCECLSSEGPVEFREIRRRQNCALGPRGRHNYQEHDLYHRYMQSHRQEEGHSGRRSVP